MEEHRYITLSLGHTTLDAQLGAYYIDFGNSIKNYTDNVWGGGFDDDKIPFLRNDDGIYYDPVNISQYGLLLISREDKDIPYLEKIAQKLISLGKEEPNHLFFHENELKSYQLEAGWVSGMTQGEVASFLLRLFQLTDKQEYFDLAKKSLEVMWLPVSENGVLTYLDEQYTWLEEYPSTPSSYVLNGFIYALYGLLDYYRITKDAKYKELIDECVKTLIYSLPKFDAGYWSYYDLLNKQLVRYYYQKNVHVLQLKSLYDLFEDPCFKKYATKWEKKLTPLNFLFVRIMYRVLPRWRLKRLRLK
jgi:heparosan-N-sulfate-glucuronate 5-epimerase